jgi:shikimate dehydrogenase
VSFPEHEVSALGVDGATRVYYVVGDPIAQVKAPARMTRGFAERGINAVCVPMHVSAADLDDFIEGATRSRNVDGMIITVPHKQAAYRYAGRPRNARDSFVR